MKILGKGAPALYNSQKTKMRARVGPRQRNRLFKETETHRN
jgi:hypothetical protein